MVELDQDIAHEIRNAYTCYKGLRLKMVRLMSAQAVMLGEIDKQLVKIEMALGGTKLIEGKKSWWRRLKSLFRAV